MYSNYFVMIFCSIENGVSSNKYTLHLCLQSRKNVSKPAGAVDTMGNRGSKKSKDNIEDIMVCTIYVVYQRYTYTYYNGIRF